MEQCVKTKEAVSHYGKNMTLLFLSIAEIDYSFEK